MRYLAAFGRFWYDFVVGDSIALAIGGVAALGLGWLVVHSDGGALAEWLLPVVVVATLAASLKT